MRDKGVVDQQIVTAGSGEADRVPDRIDLHAGAGQYRHARQCLFGIRQNPDAEH
ncbi:hypothetical protein D3C76_1499610 [compost metagenome]